MPKVMASGLQTRSGDPSHEPQSHPQPQPKVSCLRCREQKLKCSRELPFCGRCLKQRVCCTYPAPPDRRRIAQRVREAKASGTNADRSNRVYQHRSRASIDSSSGRRQTDAEDDGNAGPVISEPDELDSTWDSDVSEAADLPSTEIGLLLMEVYFTRVYNATLIFHKSITFDMYRHDEMPDFLLRAIFAHAAVFLQRTGTSHRNQVKTVAMQSVFERSWSWARSASKDVLSHADEPTLARIQALEVLQLYYFSRGDLKRCRIHLHLAYKLAQVLDYPSLRESVATESTTQHQKFDHEMKRRCFWAIWCSIALGDPNAKFADIQEEVLGLPLPAKIDYNGPPKSPNFDLGPYLVLACDSDSQLTLSSASTSESTPYSLMAKLVQSLAVWRSVKEFITELPALSSVEYVGRFEKLAAYTETMQRMSGFTVANVCIQAESHHQGPELVVSVYSVYLLSQLLLHIVMASKLAKVPSTPLATDYLTQRCSRVTLEYAGAFSDLSQLVFEKKLDSSRFWPFLGFGAFIAATVFSVGNHELLQRPPRYHSLHVPGPNSREVKTMQIIVDVAGMYWKPLRKFVTKFQKALSATSFRDLDAFILNPYPWDAAYSERISMPSAETRRSEGSFVMDMPQSQLSSISAPFEQSPAQPSASRAIDVTGFVSVANQQELLIEQSGIEDSYTGVFNYEIQPVNENMFEGATTRDELFQPNWWNTLPTEMNGLH